VLDEIERLEKTLYKPATFEEAKAEEITF